MRYHSLEKLYTRTLRIFPRIFILCCSSTRTMTDAHFFGKLMATLERGFFLIFWLFTVKKDKQIKEKKKKTVSCEKVVQKAWLTVLNGNCYWYKYYN